MRITAVRHQRLTLPLDPPFNAAWDPAPHRSFETISFHAGRPWPLEAALWDLLGQACGGPVAAILGGSRTAIPTPRRADRGGHRGGRGDPRGGRRPAGHHGRPEPVVADAG